MVELKRINDKVSVAGQILPADIEVIRSAGFVTIINNRPDMEAPGQPSSSEIRAAAEVAGIAFYDIPMGREGVSQDMIYRTRSALEGSEGPVLCFCRTGTRSTTLWALSQAGHMDAADIISAAANAGYDISHLMGHLNN